MSVNTVDMILNNGEKLNIEIVDTSYFSGGKSYVFNDGLISLLFLDGNRIHIKVRDTEIKNNKWNIIFQFFWIVEDFIIRNKTALSSSFNSNSNKNSNNLLDSGNSNTNNGSPSIVERYFVKLEIDGTDLNLLKNLSVGLQEVGLILPYIDSKDNKFIESSDGKEKYEFFFTENIFWQNPGSIFNTFIYGNLSLSVPFYPIFYTKTDLFYHPIRPNKHSPGTIIYSRFIQNLNEIFTLKIVDLEKDFEIFSEWHFNPRVAEFWGLNTSKEKQLEYLKKVISDPHTLPLIGCFNNVPCLYTEVYWAKEDHISNHVETQDFDRGFHVLVGNENLRGPHRVTAWIQSITHFCFLSDLRTMTVMLEPRADNQKLINYLLQHNFYKPKEFNFPHKRAAWMRIDRETFFDNISH